MNDLARDIFLKHGFIYKTFDYSQFSFLQGNRHINVANLRNVRNSILKKHLEVPIIVNDNLEIIDGQHRFTVCKELSLPIYFIIISGYGRSETELLNTASRKWTPEDYLESYCDLGLEQYIRAKKFMEYTGLTLPVCREFLEESPNSGKRAIAFKNGEFQPRDLRRSYEEYKMYTNFNSCPAYGNTLFVRSLINIFRSESYNHEIMKQKLEHSAYKIEVRSHMIEYFKLIEEVYNYRTRQKDRASFTKQ